MSTDCHLHGLMIPMPDAGGQCWYCARDGTRGDLAEWLARWAEEYMAGRYYFGAPFVTFMRAQALPDDIRQHPQVVEFTAQSAAGDVATLRRPFSEYVHARDWKPLTRRKRWLPGREP